MRTRVKICCMTTPSDVRAAVIAGADAIGVVGPMPSGPGPVTDEVARTIIAATPPGITPVLLSSEPETEGVLRHLQATAASVLQLVRPVDPAVHRELKAVLPALKIIQVVHVQGPEAVDLARGYALTADALLLDSGHHPDDPVEVLGGAGRAHDWRLSRNIVSRVDKPVWLAGGLTEANVGDAIGLVRPFGVDLCSAVRTLGRLDQRKLSGFFQAVRNAS